MSINYQFEVETHLDVRQAVSEVFVSLGINPPLRPVSEGSSVIYGDGPHFRIYGHPIENPEDAFSILLDLSPTVRMNFQVRLSSGNKAEEDMLRGIVSWLRVFPDNCALLFNGELVLFVRKEGKTAINGNTDFWMPSFLEIFQLSYSKVPFDIL